MNGTGLVPGVRTDSKVLHSRPRGAKGLERRLHRQRVLPCP